MNELQILNNENKEIRITSVELVEIINEFRKEESETIDKKYTELKHKSLMGKIRKELEMLKTLGLGGERNILLVEYEDKKGEKRPCYSIDSQGLKFIIDSCRTRDKIPLAKIYNKLSKGNEISICLNKPEYEFIDNLLQALEHFGITKFETQYYVCNKYKIDLYLPELNIAIEFDENEHKNYTYEQHKGRQAENELNCKFIRVNDKNNVGYNIGYCIKEILDSLWG